VVSSGLCTLDSSGDCFRSPNYPSNYGSNQTCTITAHEAVTLSVTSFDVEAEYCYFDYLRVNGGRYCGNTGGPSGVQVAAGANITWTSDDAYFFSGFEICGAFPPNSSEPRRGLSLPPALGDTAGLTSLASHRLTYWMWVMRTQRL
jgi:hypothetical protein